MSFAELLDRFVGMRALVVGDLMLDEYVFGNAARISPEAPVMVIRQQATQRRPGGAANVAQNIAALGGKPALVGVVGCDETGEFLRQALAEQGLDASHLVRDADRPTTRKTRVVADHAHQVLRIDHESESGVGPQVEKKVAEKILDLVDKSDVVVLSDYLKGLLTNGLASAIVEQCAKRKVPLVVNPKPRTLPQYAGASLVSLNRSEAAEALGLWQGLKDAEADRAADEIRKRGFQAVLITLGSAGMVTSTQDGTMRIVAPKVEVADPAGAGDTTVATVALGVGAVGMRKEVFELAARTAACVVGHVGVATPSASDLAELRKG